MRPTSAVRYTAYGATFGLVFPLAATASAVLSAGAAWSLAAVAALHATTPLLWIVDTVPLWLGLFAWLTGHREDRLQDALRTVRRQAVELQVQAQEAELSRRSAEDVSRLRSTLLTNMGHELRTPLSGIIGFAAILAEEVEEELREFAHLIEQNGRRLLDTLSAVLDLAEIDSGELALCPTDIDVAYTVQESVRFLTPLAAEKGLAVRTAGAPLPALLDAAALHRIVTSLVGNAIKFTETGTIYVETESDGATLTIRVRDTGPGIPPAFRPYLFDEFRQASTGTQREHEGSGLGLAVTKRLVEVMGGTIGAESAEGEGATFTVRLPHTMPAERVLVPAERPATALPVGNAPAGTPDQASIAER
jgi:signal transduction histidine kinase